jgi:hypothetical protein
MKRILAALFLALVVALVGPIGVAGADPPHDFTTGGGKVVTTRSDSTTLEEKFAFSAHHEGDSSSTTVARNGHFVYQQTVTLSDGTIGEFDIKGSVDCVLVSGNQAAFSGPIEKSKSSNNVPAPPVGAQAFFAVADNDSIGTPDQFSFLGFQDRLPPQPCFLPDPDEFPFTPITSGNILVNDAP